MKNIAALRALFATLASTTVVVACGGATEGIGNASSSSGSTSSSGSSGSSSSGSSGSSGSTSGGIPTPDFVPICDGTPLQYNPLSGVTVTTSVDYMEMRAERDGGDPTHPLRVTSKTGMACATATDKAKCASTLETLRSPTGWQISGGVGNSPPEHLYVVFTRGDEVGTVTSLAALTTFVAPVDTLKDAALLVTVAGRGSINCAKATGKKTATGFEIIVTSGSGCGKGDDIYEKRIAVTGVGEQSEVERVLIQEAEPSCAIGRVPEGLCPVAVSAIETLGDHFARIARLEAASVVAFDRLADELASFGAPEHLIRRAHTSADDERRHAEETSRLARRFDAEPLAAEVAAPRKRGLFDVALENATEGCVRETYGALVATHQAMTAEDAEIRAAMQTIAHDETEHAWLSWELHRWACGVLSEAQVAQLESARRVAADELATSLASEDVPGEVRRLSGHPSREQATVMFAGLRRALA